MKYKQQVYTRSIITIKTQKNDSTFYTYSTILEIKTDLQQLVICNEKKNFLLTFYTCEIQCLKTVWYEKNPNKTKPQKQQEPFFNLYLMKTMF